MDNNYINIFGLVAAAFSTISFLPQVLKVIKTNNTSGLSLWMYIVSTINASLWIAYGYMINDKIVFGSNSIAITLVLTILIYKIKNIRSGKDKN